MAKRRSTSLELMRLRPDALLELEEDFAITGNPVCAWLAMHHSLSDGSALPKWAGDYFARASSAIHRAVKTGKSTGREKSVLAKILGFEKDGQRGWLRHTILRDRDWTLHDAVVLEIIKHNRPPKLNSVYQQIAAAHGVSRAEVGKAFTRIEADLQDDDVEAERKSTNKKMRREIHWSGRWKPGSQIVIRRSSAHIVGEE